MPSKITLALGTALTGIALCCFVQSTFGQDAFDAALATTENDDVDAENKEDKGDKSRAHGTRTANNLRGAFPVTAGDNLSLGLTSMGDAVDVDTVLVTGTWYDAYPVPYPALPPVEGTRINAGKKTSFVQPAEFPTFAGNDYREAIVSSCG